MKYKHYVKGLGETKVVAVCTKNYSKMRSVPKLLSQAVMNYVMPYRYSLMEHFRVEYDKTNSVETASEQSTTEACSIQSSH